MKELFLRALLAAALLLCAPVGLFAHEGPPEAYVTQPFIELHTGPGRGYPIFYVAERGEQILLLKQRTTWVKVRTERGKEGWVKVDSILETVDRDQQPIANSVPQFTAQRRWEVGFMAGDFGGSDIVTAYSAYHFTRNLSVELAASQNFGNVSSGRSATLSLAHQPFPNWRISPYVILGGGVRITDPRSTLVATEDREDNMLLAGGGFRIRLARNFIARLQYSNNTILTNRDDDIKVEEWKIGLSALF